MTWRCGAKKADGKKCRAAVSKRGSKCQHHRRKRTAKRSAKRTGKRSAKRSAKNPRKKKRIRCRPGRNQQCAAKTQCGTRCKQYAAGRSKYCRVHKGKPLKAPKRRRNPQALMSHLQDRWSLPPLPRGTL